MSEEPEAPGEDIAVRRLRHDVDDVYEIVTTVLDEQRRQGARLTSLESRLIALETGQKEILTLLREGRG